MSMDGCSMQQSSGMSTQRQITSDYESFADCLRQSSPIAAAAANSATKKLTDTKFDDHFHVQTSPRVNGEGSSSSSFDSVERRARKTGQKKNEIPLLTHLFGAHQFHSDSNLNSLSSEQKSS